MKKFKLLLLALMCVAFLPSKADEGMWLLQLMQEQHLADRMKAQGLLLEADDIYNPNRVSLKDAVGIFGGGCTGEIISPDGLILTNHLNPEKPDVPLNKNDAFQKVQKRRVQEKR